MRRFSLLLLISMIILATDVAAQEEQLSDEELLQWAASLVQRAVVIDTHADTVGLVLNRQYDLSQRNDSHHIDIPRMFEGGVNAQFFACYLHPNASKGREVQTVLDLIDALYRVAEKDDRFVITYSAEDVLEAKREGKVSGVLCIEGGHAIVNDLATLRMFQRLGVRYLTLTWNNSNDWADASDPDQSEYGDIPHHGGLTEFGREVIREMNRIGMIVDVSHAHEDTFWDVMEVTTKPIIASHSDCWAINPHHRNLKDEQLQAIAKNGGVVGINYYAGFLSKEYMDQAGGVWDEMRQKRRELQEQYKDDVEGFDKAWNEYRRALRERLPEVPLSVLVDHIDHIVKVAGIDHVGLGSDFDGISAAPVRIEDTTDIVWIVVELRKRGYSEEEIRKILGENTLRVMREVIGS